MKTKVLVGIVCLIILSSSSVLADWPQYLGPERNGISPETSLASSWPEDGPKVLWTNPVGKGFAGVSIQDGKVYLVDRVESTNDVIRCYDLKSGEELWHYSNEDAGEYDYNGSRNPPTIDEENLYSVGGMGSVYCINLTSHELVWKRDFKEDFDAEKPWWGFAQSPLLYKNLVIAAPQSANAGAVAYDKNTGEIVWQTERLCDEPGYSSVMLTTIGGVEQIILVTPLTDPDAVEEEDEDDEDDEDDDEEEEDEGPPFEEGGVYGINAETGEILWNYRNFTEGVTIPPVTLIGDSRMFVTGGGGGSTMLKLRHEDGEFEVIVQFKTKEYSAHIHPALLYKEHLYMNSGGNDGLICVTLEGKVLWQSGRDPKFGRGGLIIAEDKIYAVEGDKGHLYLAKATPEKYTQLGLVEEILKGDEMWAPLALSDGKLVIRDQEKLMCLEVK
ncbi:PQQ-binding-like beta-propeller repeat protein [Planctomycetota bacterium]